MPIQVSHVTLAKELAPCSPVNVPTTPNWISAPRGRAFIHLPMSGSRIACFTSDTVPPYRLTTRFSSADFRIASMIRMSRKPISPEAIRGFEGSRTHSEKWSICSAHWLFGAIVIS